MADERRDESPGRATGARVHDDAGRLVDDEEILVLERYDEILGRLHRLVGRHRNRSLERDLLAARQAVALRPHDAVDTNSLCLDQPFGRTARADHVLSR
jgi:hypothetical protein